jgi:predicted nucleic acid-binding protein
VSTPSAGLLDTSVFIARETGRPLQELPDQAVMVAWARLVADCRAAGAHRLIKLTDALIAATAIEHGLPVVTQDDDYARMARAHPALRIFNV